jgi:hypothetical protein
MAAPDDFSSYISELLEGSYDCVDRIALCAPTFGWVKPVEDF